MRRRFTTATRGWSLPLSVGIHVLAGVVLGFAAGRGKVPPARTPTVVTVGPSELPAEPETPPPLLLAPEVRTPEPDPLPAPEWEPEVDARFPEDPEVPDGADGEFSGTAVLGVGRGPAGFPRARRRTVVAVDPAPSPPAAPRVAPPPGPTRRAAPLAGECAGPDYPDRDRRRGIEGTAVLRVAVDGEGAVTAVDIERSSGSPSLDGAALDAILAWRFSPALREGRPVPDVVLVPVAFVLLRPGTQGAHP